MKEILPVPVALAKPYLNSEQFEKYLEAYEAFYDWKTDIDARSVLRVIEKNMEDMPEVSDAFPSEPFVDLKIKYNQLLSFMADVLKENWREDGILSPEADRMKKRSMDMLRYYADVKF